MTLADALFKPVFCEPCASDAKRLAAGWLSFNAVRNIGVGSSGQIISTAALEAENAVAMRRLTRGRPDLLGLSFDRPRIMGVLNTTPDSFSDGGANLASEVAVESGLAMLEAGAEILDIGGESTRPGAEPVAEEEELARVLPVVEALRAAAPDAVLSIDTRKPRVARAAFKAGARLYNDVSALTFDPSAPKTAAELVTQYDGAVCLMHAQGDPRTMQENPQYQDVLLDVLRFLAERMRVAIEAGAPEDRIIVDPGIGFGKTLSHNLSLLRGLGALHSLGAPVLLGASRKRFIGALSGEAEASKRGPGSIAAALHGLAQGAQILRVHDVAETAQAVKVWMAMQEGAGN